MASMKESGIPGTVSRTAPVPYRENGKFGTSRTFPIRGFREFRESFLLTLGEAVCLFGMYF